MHHFFGKKNSSSHPRPQLPPTKWKGLKLLPTAAPSASSDEFRQMVRGLIAMLDPELAAALPPLLPRRASSRQLGNGNGAAAAAAAMVPTSPSSAERRRAAGSLFDGLINSNSEDDDSDEDWKADMERERKLLVGAWMERA